MLDHLSPELQALYQPPRANEVRVYRLLGIRPKKSKEGVSAYTVPNSRSLPDSYLVVDNNEQKTVVYTERMLPTDDPQKVRRKAGIIEFRMENIGEIRIQPENYARMAQIDKFLFFCPWVKHSDGLKDWQTRDNLGQFIELVDKQGEARKLLEKEDSIFDAKMAINEMTEKDMEITILQMKLGMPKFLTFEEKKAALVKASSNEKYAKKITAMQGEEDMMLRRFLLNAVDKGIITNEGNDWNWGEGGELITKKMPGKTVEDSLIYYLKTEQGGEVKVMIELTLEAKTTPVKKEPAPKKEETKSSAKKEKQSI